MAVGWLSVATSPEGSIAPIFLASQWSTLDSAMKSDAADSVLLRGISIGEPDPVAFVGRWTVPFFMGPYDYSWPSLRRGSMLTAIPSIHSSTRSRLKRHRLPTLEAGILPF